jgi:hypothetical protein
VAISFIQGASNGAANAGPVTVTFDSALTAGDLLLAFHVDGDTADNAMPAIVTPTGMADVGTSEQYANATNDCNSKAWYKYAAGGETSVVFPDTGGGTNDGVSGVIMVFRGVASAAQGGPFSTAIQKTTGTGSGHANPPQIATAAGDAVVIMGGAAHATAGVTFTAPTNYTTNAEPGTAGTDTISSGAGMAYRLSGYANPEDPGAFTASATAAGDSWNAVTLALKEATAPAGQQLDGSLFTKAPTFPTGTLSSTFTLSGTTFTKAPTFPQGILSSIFTLTGTTFTKAPTFPQGALQQAGGSQQLDGATFTKAPTFPQGTFTSIFTLAGTTFQKTPTFPSGGLSGTVTLPGGTFILAPTFPTGSLGAGATYDFTDLLADLNPGRNPPGFAAGEEAALIGWLEYLNDNDIDVGGPIGIRRDRYSYQGFDADLQSRVRRELSRQWSGLPQASWWTPS